MADYRLSYTATEIDRRLQKIDILAEKSEIPTKTSQLANDSGYLTTPPVISVNDKTGAVSLTASDVNADAKGTANSTVSTHNTNTTSHNDIRLLIEDLTTRLNALANSDDTTLDQMSEIVAYIKANRGLIESVTTDKVNVSDIINNLTTNVSNKPLSAAQGVALKALIDALQTTVDGKASSTHKHAASDITSGTIASARLPAASGTAAGITIVYPAASCTTFSSDSGTVTPLAVQKGAKQFAITRPTGTTANTIARYSNTTGDVKESKILIEDVTNTRDTSKKANVISIPAEGGKKMVYGYCTDQVDGTSFIGGVFDANATEFPYSAGLAIGGTSGNLLWKGSKVATADDLNTKLSTTGTAAKATADANGNNIVNTYETKANVAKKVDKDSLSLGLHTDGLFYIFVDGTPIGNGIALPQGSAGDVVGNIDSDNNIVLTGDIPDGNYAIKYKMPDGTLVDIGDLEYFEDPEPDTPTYENILEKYEIIYNKRWSSSSSALVDCNGMICIAVPLADVRDKIVRLKGFTPKMTANSKSAIWYICNGNTVLSSCATTNASGNVWYSPVLTTDANGISSVPVNLSTFNVLNNGTTLYMNLAVHTSASISKDNLSGCSITFEEDTTTYTNQIPISTDASGNLFTGTSGEKGYKTGYKLSTSTGAEAAATGYAVTGFIPVSRYATLCFKNITANSDDSHVIIAYGANKNKLTDVNGALRLSTATLDQASGVYALGMFNNYGATASDNIAYIRICSSSINQNSIVTVNQMIK